MNEVLYQFYHLGGEVLEPIFREKDLPPERKGKLPGPVDLWLHASSVGEATVAAAILEEFLKIRPKTSVLLTLFTPTGAKKARELIKDRVKIALAPYDLPGFIDQALTCTSPKVMALIETEIWPNLIVYSHQKGAKVLLLNGRLSPKSFPRYRLVKPLLRGLFLLFSGLAVIGPSEAKRFEALGAPLEKIQIFGNAKHDLLKKRAESLDPEIFRKRLRIGQEEIIVFGSVRHGEEKAIVRSIKGLWPRKNLVFIVVPRHLKRLITLERSLNKEGLSFIRWSRLKGRREQRIVVVDEIGPLFGLYSLAKVAFVGGSLVPKGGQNPMEPAAFGVPVLFGPHMENFENEARGLKKRGGGFVVQDTRELIFLVEELLDNRKLYNQASFGARKTLKDLTGAASKQAQWLAQFL